MGNPEFWQVARDVNAAAFLAAHNLTQLFLKLRSKPVRGELSATLSRIMTATFNSFGAVTILVLNGYDTDAMRIVRGMFEAEVIAEYLRKHQEKVKDYNAFLYASIQQEVQLLEETAPELLANNIEPEVLREAGAKFAAVEEQFRHRKGYIKSSWTDASIYQMAVETGREFAYRTLYRWACGISHFDITGLTAQFDEGTGSVDIAPSSKWLPTAMMHGHAAVLSVMKDFNEEAGLGFDADITAAGNEFHEAWKGQFRKP